MHRRALWLIIGILGCVTLVTLTCLGGLLALATLLSGPGSLTATQTLPMAGMLLLGPILGIPLVLQGWAGWRGRPSRPFNPPRAWWLWLALVVLVALGAAISLLPLAPALLLPPIHVLVMALLPLLMLWLVGRASRGRAGSWRDVVAGMAGGGFLGMTVALIGEGLVILAAIIVLTVVVMMTPGAPERINELATRMQDPAWATDIQNLLPLLLSPAVVLSALGVFSIPVPLIEEAVKTLATGIAGRWIRPTPVRAFLWGVAGGAGFALAENLFNGAIGGVEGWAPGALSRFGATALHCFTGGLVGWGWGQLWTARRPLRLLGCYAVAVAIHALWNAGAVGAAFLGVSLMAHEGEIAQAAFTLLGTLALMGLLALLTVAFVAALILAARRLTAQAERLQGQAPTLEEPPVPEASEALSL
jgi:hypothetical protein